MTDDTPTRWQQYARWQLGRITNGEYADYLESQESEASPATDILVAKLRENPDGRYANRKPA